MDKPNDEIDIFEFCSRLGETAKNCAISVLIFLLSIVILVFRKLMWIGAAALLGVLVGCIVFAVAKPYTVSSLEASTGGVENTVVIDHINKLDVKQPHRLANALGITKEQADKIRSIKAYYGIDVNRDGVVDYVDFDEKYNPEDTMHRRLRSFVHLEVSLFDESILPKLREGLLRYIDDNPYVKSLHEIIKAQEEQMLVAVDNEISKIEKLQMSQLNREANRLDSSGTTIFMTPESENRTFSSDILELYEKRHELEKRKQLFKNTIVVIHDFIPSEEIVNTLAYYLSKSVIALSILGFITSLIWQYRKKLYALLTDEDELTKLAQKK